ncbi:MAG TPA: hypothetical protein PK530_01465 [Anaerolineales bacterium]|nr:hypothetical protein [Anaerolineales bacterium]
MQKGKKLSAKEEAARKAEEEARQVRRANFRRELLGMFGGIGLAMVISSFVPAIREHYSLGVVILWGGAIGGVVMSLERFEHAGPVLTKKDNRALNYVVGLGLPILLLLLIFWIK